MPKQQCSHPSINSKRQVHSDNLAKGSAKPSDKSMASDHQHSVRGAEASKEQVRYVPKQSAYQRVLFKDEEIV